MIYLLTQMVLALVLAAVLGGALGWILHRTTQDKDTGNLKNVINRQRQQLGQLQSEIAMLTDDYDELQRQAHDELHELREANQQIPYISSNLEKSQLLVSQMLKKHDSQLRELNAQNQSLTEKLKVAEDREQAYNKLQADLDSDRRSKGASAKDQSITADSSTDANADEPAAVNQQADTIEAETPKLPADTVTAFDSESGVMLDDGGEQPAAAPVARSRRGKSSTSSPVKDTPRGISNARNTGSWASAPVAADAAEPEADPVPDPEPAASAPDTDTNSNTVAESPPDIATKAPRARSAATASLSELLDEDLDDVHVVVDEDIVGIDDFESDSDIDELGDATISLADEDLDEIDVSEEFAQTIDNSRVIFLNADMPETDADRDSDDSNMLGSQRRGRAVVTETELELPELPADVFDVDPFDQVIEIGDDLQKELDDDEANPFDPVERHDDLQQIVGIDPMTEKALNELGITSFAQLAKLKHHEIETIANALKIVPSRIENDDWVGNARRQLEDVLEEL